VYENWRFLQLAQYPELKIELGEVAGKLKLYNLMFVDGFNI
jgi:hypothetical protein